MRSRLAPTGPPLDFRFLDLLILLVLGCGTFAATAMLAGIGNDASSPLTIENTQLPNGYRGFGFRQELIAVGGSRPYRWEISGLPDGVFIESGLLTGAPKASGKFAVPLKVVDSAGSSAERALMLTVVDASAVLPLHIQTEQILPATAQAKYQLTLAAEGGVSPYKWAVESLPSGLVLSGPNISGRATEAGLSRVKVRVTDALDQTEHREFDLQVLPARFGGAASAIEPLVASTLAPPAVSGVPYELQLAARGGVPPYHWELTTEVHENIEVTTDGILRAADPSKWPRDAAFRVRVIDSTNGYAFAELRPKTIVVNRRWLQLFLCLAAVGGWSVLLMLLRATSARTRLLIDRPSFDWAHAIGLCFLFVALIAATNATLGTVGFVVLVSSVAVYLFVGPP